MRFHFVDSTEPSVLAHEILNAAPYAFLDDGEAIDRRSRAVPLRRGLPVAPEQLGRVTQEAIDRVRAEIEPAPTTPDELHDLLSTLLLSPCPPEWGELLDALERTRPGRRRSSATTARARWHTVEATAAVRGAGRGRRRRRHHGRAGGRAGASRPPGGGVAADARRPGRRAPACRPAGSPSGSRPWRPRASPSRGASASGPSTPRTTRRRSSGRAVACSPACTPTRAPSGGGASNPSRAEQLMRFLVQWHHVTGATQHRGVDGLARVIGQLQGYETAVGAWEPQVLARRVHDYDPAWLDRLCHQGEVTWLRLKPPSPDDPDRRLAGATRTTPVSLVLRADLPWLLAAHRGETSPPVPACGAVAEVVEVLTAKGACFASELARATGRVLADVEAALWEGMARGLLVSDGFEPVRAVASGRRHAPPTASRRARLRSAGPASHRDRRPVVARARRRHRHRSGRAGRGAGRPAPRTLGRGVLRPRGRRAPGRALARPPVGAAPHGGSRARRRRPVRAGLQRRAVRAPAGGRGPAGHPPGRAHGAHRCASPAPTRSTSPASCSPAIASPPAPPSGSTCPSDRSGYLCKAARAATSCGVSKPSVKPS